MIKQLKLPQIKNIDVKTDRQPNYRVAALYKKKKCHAMGGIRPHAQF